MESWRVLKLLMENFLNPEMGMIQNREQFLGPVHFLELESFLEPDKFLDPVNRLELE